MKKSEDDDDELVGFKASVCIFTPPAVVDQTCSLDRRDLRPCKVRAGRRSEI